MKINSTVRGQTSISVYTFDGLKINERKRDAWVSFKVAEVYGARIVYTVNAGTMQKVLCKLKLKQF